MKTKSSFLSLLLAVFFLSSCSTITNFYQVYTTTPVSEMKVTNENIVYEDDNCKVIYDFWGQSGNLSFVFQNKTNELITVNKDQCFYILNGFAYDYYKNRTYSNSNSTGITTARATAGLVSVTGLNYNNNIQTNQLGVQKSGAISNSNSRTVSEPEALQIKIPANTSKEIQEFSIYDKIYRDCDLLRFPLLDREINTLKFTKDNSPVLFTNSVEYTIGNSNPIRIENKFYVSEITNLPSSKMYDSKMIENCKEKSLYPVEVNIRKPANYFYNIYPYETPNSFLNIWKY